MEELNRKIENYLLEIDKKYGTNYSPSGLSRIMQDGGGVDNEETIDVYDYQDSHGERIVSKSWNGTAGNYWRYKFENAGDILRELSKYKDNMFNTGYIYEKVNKIEEFIKGQTERYVHPDDNYLQLKKDNLQNILDLSEAYTKQPVS